MCDIVFLFCKRILLCAYVNGDADFKSLDVIMKTEI